MIQSVNASGGKLRGGIVVAAGGSPDVLLTLPAGKAHTQAGIATGGRLGTVSLKYGPGTVPHTATVRVGTSDNPFPRAITIAVVGPGEYAVEHRVSRIFGLSTSVDPKGALDVLLRWRAIPAKKGSVGLLGALDIEHPDVDDGQPVYIRNAETAVVHGGLDTPIANGELMVPTDTGVCVPTVTGDEGEAIGTFHRPVIDPSKNLYEIKVRPGRL